MSSFGNTQAAVPTTSSNYSARRVGALNVAANTSVTRPGDDDEEIIVPGEESAAYDAAQVRSIKTLLRLY
jgi:hypothetical protein